MNVMKFNPNLLNYINAAFSALAGILLVPIFISWAGTDLYGAYAKTTLILSAFFILDFGFSSITLRIFGKNDPFKFGKLLFVIILAFLYSIFLLLIAYGINWFKIFDVQIEYRYSWLLPLYFFIKVLDDTSRASLVGSQQIKYYSLVSIFHTLIRYAFLAIWFLSDELPLYTIVLVLCLTNMLTFFLTLNLIQFNLKLRKPIPILCNDYKYMIGCIFTGALSFSLLQIDKAFAAKTWSNSDFTMYSVASGLAGFIFICSVPLTQKFQPLLFRKGISSYNIYTFNKTNELYLGCVIQMAILITLSGHLYLKYIFVNSSVKAENFMFYLIYCNILNAASWQQIFIFHIKNKLLRANILQVITVTIYISTYFIFDHLSMKSAPYLALLSMQIIGFNIIIPLALRLYFDIKTFKINLIFSILSFTLIYFIKTISNNISLIVTLLFLFLIISFIKSPIIRFIGIKPTQRKRIKSFF